jgi:hypothetical protein
VNPLDYLFPNLARSGFRITSPRDYHYNCIAWAAGNTIDWWWPGPDPDLEYWPANIAREVTLAAFQAVFATLGYIPSPIEQPEPNTEKIALYANAAGSPLTQRGGFPTAVGRASLAIGKTSNTHWATWKAMCTAKLCES